MVDTLSLELRFIDNHLQAEFFEGNTPTGEYIDLKACEEQNDDLSFLGDKEDEYIKWKNNGKVFPDDDKPF